MFLKQTHSFYPNKHGFTINTRPNIAAIHPSADNLAFVTRSEQLILYNRKTGRASVPYRSKHGIMFVTFTDKYLIAIQKNFPDILVFSVKTEKLKKKITGHRSQVLQVSYSSQRGIFCSISHDVCIIWEQGVLSIIKKIKCSTSQYTNSLFSPNGKYLFTSFSDGNIFRWDLDTFQSTQRALKIQPHLLACTYSQFIVAYHANNSYISDFSNHELFFQQIEQFWEGKIQKIDFSNNNILVKTTNGLYIGQVSLSHKIHITNAKQLVDTVSSFIIGGYGEDLVIINKQLTCIKTMKIVIEASSDKIPLTNTLINPANQCAGGFSDSNGCINNETVVHTYPYQNQQHKLQEMNNGIYMREQSLSNEKLKVFIRKNFYFPDKYRPTAYKSLLGLPINKNMFRDLQKQGRHECVKMLESKYPLTNRNLAESFKDVMSLLGNYSQVFAESQDVPAIVFPFVCLFGNDKFFCFQILYRLFNNWLSFLFTDFPLANSELLQNIHQILQSQSITMLNHLKSFNISFTKLVWSLLSSLFSTNLKRQAFLSIIDTLFSHNKQPQFIIYIIIGYLRYNQTRILSMRSQQDLNKFLDQQHTVNVSVFLKKAYQMQQKHQRKLRYPFQALQIEYKMYVQFNDYPRHAVRMYQGKRRLQQEQFDKNMDNQKYHYEMSKQMEKMVVMAKRQSQKATIQGESVSLHNQNECKNKLNMPKIKEKQRRQRLQSLISQIKAVIEQSEQKKTVIKQFAPLLNQVYQEQNDEQLDLLQEKLMSLLTKFQPSRFHRPLKSVPVPFGKTKVEDYKMLKAAKNSQMANKIWQNDKIHHKIQEQNWEKDFMNSVP